MRIAFIAALAGALGVTAAMAQQAPAPRPAPAPPAAAQPQATPEQQAAPEESDGDSAVDWIRGALARQQYDPEDRARARNYGPEFEAGTYWRSTIFDGRRSRATHGTGLTLPKLPQGETE